MKYNEIEPFVAKSREYPNYSDKDYWVTRYENVKGPFDWYDDYETLSPTIQDLKLPKRSFILNIGIGNSDFSEKMYDDGYKKSYNIDFARNVIHYMRQRNKRLRSSMIFETMNVLDLDYEDHQFDVVFDKAVFDCVLCGIDADKKASIFMKEVYRVIRPKGYYFLVSNSEPENRLQYLQAPGLKYDIVVHTITNDQEQVDAFGENGGNMNVMKKTHYIYICQKMEEPDENEEEWEEEEDTQKEEEKKEKIEKDKNNEILEINDNNNDKKEEDKKTEKSKAKSTKSKSKKRKKSQKE